MRYALASVAALLVAGHVHAGSGNIQINEIRIDMPGSDTDEYVELKGDPGASLAGITLIVIGDGGGGSGTIEAVVEFTGSIPADGYFLAAEDSFGVTGSPGDVDLFTNLNFENGDNVTYILVTGFTGLSGDDLDIDDDCALDSTPWATEIDRIALLEETNPPSGTECHYGPPLVGPDGTFVPAHVYRCETKGAWIIGSFDPADSVDSPGAVNPDCPEFICPPTLELNEIRIGQTGADDDEYIEIKGAAGVAMDTACIVVVGGNGGDMCGRVQNIITLSGTMPADGHYLVAADADTLGASADLVTPLGLGDDQNLTIFLVCNCDGISIGDDLDVDDDGTLDGPLGQETIDAVAVFGSTECTYAFDVVGPDILDVPQHIYRCEIEGDWLIGDGDVGVGVDTPGTVNPDCPNIDCANGLDISEIRIDQPGTDNDEYFEISGDPGASLDNICLVVIGDSAGNSCGVVEDVIDLSGNVIPADGLFLVAEDGDTFGSTADLIVPMNFEDGNNLTFFLVCNCGPLTPGVDLDANDDGDLDAQPWDFIIDGISTLGGTNCTYSFNEIGPDGGSTPGHIYRCEFSGEWTIGSFDPNGGDDTPGTTNTMCPAVDCAEGVVINELRTDQPGSDIDEYIELKGTPGTSLNNMCLIVIGDLGTNDPCGPVERVIDLSGNFIAGDGHFLIAADTDTLGQPADLEIGGFNIENGDNLTFLLVCNCDGLTTGTDLDTDNDGTLDLTPWQEILDSVSIVGVDVPGDCFYAEAVGPDDEVMDVPAHIWRCDDTGVWEVGTLDPLLGNDSPGQSNEDCGGGGGGCFGDTDGNDAVNVDDLVNVILDFGSDGTDHGGDINNDGVVNVDDLVQLILAFGPCP